MSTLNFSSLCRVCLTRNSQMIPLKSLFSEVVDDAQNANVIISDMLSIVLNFSPIISGLFPHFICPMCLDVLKTAYDLKILFDESNQILQEFLGQIEEKQIVKDEGIMLKPNLNKSNASAVELIAGPHRYDLNDLIIVENDHKTSEPEDFEGFLKNLGKTISASFVHNKMGQKQSSLPVIEIHTMGLNADDGESNGFVNCTRTRSNSVDQFILIEGNEIQEIHKNLKEDVKYSESDIKHLKNTDKELIQSALNFKYECMICKRVYALESRYNKHIETCQKTSKVVKDKSGKKLVSLLQCPYCSRIFKQQKFLTYHIKVAHKTPFFTCEICNVKLKTKSAYSYHKQTKHADKHICQYCGKCLTSSTSLNVHLEIHSRETARCICPVCGKTFHYKGGLFYHMKQHTKERKYKCDYCDKNFYTLTGQERHIRTHTGIRPYECRFCEKRFFSSGERKRHEYIHTGTLPYRCQYCDKGFTSRFNLKVHWFNHSGDFACEHCGKRFVSDEVLQFHYKIKHKYLLIKDE